MGLHRRWEQILGPAHRVAECGAQVVDGGGDDGEDMRMLEIINMNMVMMMKTVTITKIMMGTPRILLAYPAGYQYGQYHHHDYLYPKYGWCITN